jgi:2'-5' RNA ligase
MESEPALRLFVALALPGAVREALEGWRGRALARGRGLRAVSATGLHVTLCFLGAQPSEAVAGVLAAASGALGGCGAAPLALGEPLWLPRRAPRVLAVGIRDPSGRLAAVHDRLATALVAGGWYARERRPFLAHVTVARVPRGVRVGAPALDPPPPVAFTGDAVVLFRSRLGQGGARYEALGELRLGAG